MDARPPHAQSAEDNLDRFVQAQRQGYPTALAEIRGGRKRSHWMWCIFPHLRGLGSSPMAHTYGIRDMAEARVYLQYPILGPRLLEITGALLALEKRSACDLGNSGRGFLRRLGVGCAIAQGHL